MGGGDRIYFDDCEKFNGLCYFPYHYFDPQWTWMPKAPDCQYCYTPKFDTDEVQGNNSIKIESDIYRIHEGFWPGDPLNCWVLNGTDLDASVRLICISAGGTATFTFLGAVSGNANWRLNPCLAWNSCGENSGMPGNNNVYIIAENGTKIGIHSRNETWYQFPIVVHNLYTYITVNDVVQDSWYKHIDGAAEPQPSASWSYLEKVGNTYTYHIKYSEVGEYDTISATASLSEIEIFKYVGPTVDYLNKMISSGYNWYYTDSYGMSYIYKNLYEANVDQIDLPNCDTLYYSLKAPTFLGTEGIGELSPDALLQQDNLTGTVSDIDDDPDDLIGDGQWLNYITNSVDTVCRVSFPTPEADLKVGDGLQNFKIRVRQQPDGAGANPTVRIELYENGSQVAVLMNDTPVWDVTYGQLFQADWNANLLSNIDGSQVELYIYGTAVGGSPANKCTIEVGAVEWNVRHTGGKNLLKFCFGFNAYDQYEYDIPITKSSWEQHSIDISDLPGKEDGIKYIGFKYVHDSLGIDYDDFIMRYDNIYSDPSEPYIPPKLEDYAFIM